MLATAIKAFIGSARLTRDDVSMPGETEHDRLLDAITDCLRDAVNEGRSIATGKQERGIIDAAKNVAGRAVQLVGDIVDSVRKKAKEILDQLFGGSEVDDPDAVLVEAQSELSAWAEEYSEGVASNEIQAAVQEAIYDEMQDQGVLQLDIVPDPDACAVCMGIIEESPTVSIEDGERLPPFHFRCRCEAIAHEE